jgi:hypothetical protein
MNLQKMVKEAQEIRRRIREGKCQKVPECPVEYAKQKGLKLTSQQVAALKALTSPPYSLLVRAAHSVGKTFLAAVAAAWFYDRHNPGLCLTTAPTLFSVRDLLFRELRRIKPDDPDWLPKATRLESSQDHWIHGFTASKGDSFQGRHMSDMMVVFDEAAGVDVVFWDRSKTMVEKGRKGHYFLAIYNPYDTSCPAYIEEQSGVHAVMEMSALDHPNVKSGMEIVPGAITRSTVHQRVHTECRKLEPGEPVGPNSFVWDSEYYEPESPLFEVQILGRWPSRSVASVWSDRALEYIQQKIPINPDWLVQIGCDPARFGDDRTAICIRKGMAIIHMEFYRGWSLNQTADRLKELCGIHQTNGQPARAIPVLIDAAGLGAGLVDMRGRSSDRYNFVEINSALKSRWEGDYTNLRSELWFNASELADAEQISIAMLPEDIRQALMLELRQPIFTLDTLQRRMVEAKAMTKRRLKCSPDLADAFNLACFLRSHEGFTERVTGRI